MIKRYICAFLALCMAIAIVASCGSTNSGPGFETKSGGNESSTKGSSADPLDETETDSKFVSDDIPADVTFDDFVFTVLYSVRGCRIISEVEDFTGDLIEDAIYENSEYIKDRFHITYDRIDAGGDQEMAAKVNNSVLGSGTKNEFSVSIGHDYLTIGNVMKGCYTNLTGVPVFNNFSKPWWPANNLASISVGGKLYSASSYLSYSPLMSSSVVIFNKNICKDLQLDEPYQIVFDGDWTYESMTAYCEAGHQDNDGDGVIDLDAGEIYGFTLGSEGGYKMQRGANVVPILKDDGDLPYVNDDLLEPAYDFMSCLDDLCSFGKFFNTDNKSHVEVFGSGGAFITFSTMTEVYGTVRSYENIKYGFLPNPKLNDLQEEYITGSTDVIWGIPQTSTDYLTEIATIIEAISCQCYNNVLPVVYESTMTRKLAEAPDDAQVLDIIRDTTALSFAYFYFQFLGQKVCMADFPRNTTTNTISSYIGSNSPLLETKLKELMDVYEELENLG